MVMLLTHEGGVREVYSQQRVMWGGRYILSGVFCGEGGSLKYVVQCYSYEYKNKQEKLYISLMSYVMKLMVIWLHLIMVYLYL